MILWHLKLVCVCYISLSSEIYEDGSLHGHVKVVIRIIIQDESFVHISALFFLVDVYHSVDIFDHEDIVLHEVFFGLVASPLQHIAAIEVDVP